MICQNLKVDDKLAYLGTTFSRVVYIDDEVTAKMAKASVPFEESLQMSVTEN